MIPHRSYRPGFTVSIQEHYAIKRKRRALKREKETPLLEDEHEPDMEAEFLTRLGYSEEDPDHDRD